MKRYAAYVLVFVFLFTNQILQAAGTEVQQVAPGVYAGEATTSAGEKIYFGMEMVDAGNKVSWENYLSALRTYGVSGNASRGTLNYLTIFANPEKRKTLDLSDQGLLKITGMTSEELNQYMDMLASKQSYEKKMRNDFKNIEGGEAGFNISVSTPQNPYFVVYASKKPVIGRYTAPQVNNLKEYMASYGDIIMTVGSWLTENKDFYQNRGIFRNPLSVVEGTYKNISLQLHGFSAAVMEKFYPERKLFIVHALPSMFAILEKNLKPGDGYLGNNNMPDDLKKVLPGSRGFGALDIPVVIKTEALARFYKN